MIDLLVLFLFPAAMAFAASSDLLTMTISNRVSLALIASFFVVALLIGMGAAEIGMHVAAAFLVLVVAFGLFAAGWIGGGDAKLAASTALWLGFEQLAAYLLYASVMGGVLTVLLLRYRREPMPYLLVGQEWAEHLHQPDTGVPYGIALAAAALLLYPQSIFMQSLGL